MSGSDELADLFAHAITVRTCLGTDGSGRKLYADPVEVPCFLSGRQRYIRGGDGQQIIASATASADIGFADALAPQSLVTAPDGRTTVVMQRDTSDAAGWLGGIARVKAYLQ